MTHRIDDELEGGGGIHPAMQQGRPFGASVISAAAHVVFEAADGDAFGGGGPEDGVACGRASFRDNHASILAVDSIPPPSVGHPLPRHPAPCMTDPATLRRRLAEPLTPAQRAPRLHEWYRGRPHHLLGHRYGPAGGARARWPPRNTRSTVAARRHYRRQPYITLALRGLARRRGAGRRRVRRRLKLQARFCGAEAM